MIITNLQDKKNIWHKESYSKEGVFDDVTKYKVSKLLNDEAKYKIDLIKTIILEILLKK